MDERGSNSGAIRELCLNDRYYLLVRILKRYDAWHPWLYARCREVEESPDGYIDIWAREHYKSTIITFAGIIHEIIRNPEITIGIFSHTKPIAKGFLAQLQRELESNETLHALFPEILWSNPAQEAPSWSLDGGLVVRRGTNPKEATVEAHGLVDGQPTSKHFQLLIYDDVVTLESVNTPEQILKTTEAWQMSDNLGVAGGRKWIIGTRYHYADTYADIINRGVARLRKHAATIEGTVNGNLVLLTKDQWRKKLLDQPATVHAQLLCDPLAGKQRVFDINQLRVYEVRPSQLMVYLIVDPGRSVKKESADTAMIVIGIDGAGNKYVLDGVAHKMELPERWKWLSTLWSTWFTQPGVQFVHVGYERYGAQSDLDYFKERQNLDGEFFEITPLPRDTERGKLASERSKPDRIKRLLADISEGAQHRWYLPYQGKGGDHGNNLTSAQRRMLASGYGFRLAEPIRRKDGDKKIYDFCERFRMQLNNFPFGGLVDIIDAASRLYDMDPRPPDDPNEVSLEPDVVF